jgi:hypothetical protein
MVVQLLCSGSERKPEEAGKREDSLGYVVAGRADSHGRDAAAGPLVGTVTSMAATIEKVEKFFERYAAALLARDEKAMAGMYAVPSLVLFPGNVVLVTDAKQTEEFFAASWSQYEGVDEFDPRVAVMGEAPGSVWADVRWSYGGQPRERFCYQLLERSDGYQIAVLTPMELTL